ncbi:MULTISPECIES: ABC transporter ATP-binding protein [Streptomyces]|uniref:dipeptide ABC transporter ATP-binding protein n=1 Tax=Streptomyces TaxID=1883 RepID=UPI0010391ADA|nr:MULTISPECIES: ABC transporter ATP-binding protein [Streptomyces]MBT3075759.1 ABC transporter ATP-binding protein [Streptomyces sp. COG21]MBT3079727.1 ABC transporter ATP-binding protein [Streptomyces sp. COG20]MBT3101150.1 ABC transporter ATP-binding protein [Streptomyces sp. CBG30]MBT3106398.1 ABC transporter ATP-binding protein [Streptomyces sp. COG19]MDI7786082.1 ABC transporter ATP-binding protein [Streptomyces cavourensis]
MTKHEPSVEPLVEVAGLTVDFGSVRAVDGLSFTLEAGGALAVVGESGSGKSASAYALLGLHRGTGARVGGTVRVAGTDVNAADDRQLRALRGAQAAMVFQDPLSSLDPYYPVGDQIAEVIRVHRRLSRRAARARAVEVLDRVGIPDAARRSRLRPHEFSGGMRQRALIAMALACEPRLIVADEPTTALDVTVQAQILDLLHDLRQETGMGLLLVTHDVGVAAESVDEVLVMRGGREVERGPVARVLGAPREAYTKELLAAVPRVETRRAVPPVTPGPVLSSRAAVGAPADGGADEVSVPLLEAVDLRREFGRGSGRTVAVGGVSLAVHAGRTLGIVGESGSGKTTLGRILVRLLDPTAGRLRYGGTEIGSLPEKELRPFRRELQMVFQDPVASLNPRRSVGESVADPLRAAGERDEERVRDRVGALLERVGLDRAHFERYPHEFSGGQRQRIGIARALAAEPKVIVCDEAVSALDVTTQAQVVALLAELQRELSIGLVFIAHDLAVVRQVSDHVAVMRGGLIVEQGPADEVYEDPRDPYTRQLLAAVPALDPGLAAARRAARKELAAA